MSLLLQLYSVRELLAAKLFFGIGFAALLALGGVLMKTRAAETAGALNVGRKDWIGQKVEEPHGTSIQ